VKTIND